MLCKAIYGRLPDQLPATLEDVIDGSVKTGLDLAPVKQWNQMALTRMVKHGQKNVKRAMPKSLLKRLPEWLDALTAAMEMHKAQYWAEVEALAYEACPPIEVFEYGRDWLHIGKELRQAYSRVIRQAISANDEADPDDVSAALNTSFDAARIASEAFLNQWPVDKRHNVLIGAAAYLYAQGPQNGESVRDALVWQLGRK